MASFKKSIFIAAASAMIAGSPLPSQAQNSYSLTLDGSTAPEKSGWKKSGNLELKTFKEGEKTLLDLYDQSETDLVSLSKNIPPEMNAMIKTKGFVLEITMKIFPGMNSQGFSVNITDTLNYMISVFADDKMQSINIWDDKLKKQVGWKIDGADKFHTWKLVYRPPKDGVTPDNPGQADLFVDGAKVISDITPAKSRAGNLGYVNLGGIGPTANQRAGRVLIEKLAFRLPGENEQDKK